MTNFNIQSTVHPGLMRRHEETAEEKQQTNVSFHLRDQRDTEVHRPFWWILAYLADGVIHLEGKKLPIWD